MKSIRKFGSVAEYSSAIESLNGLDNYLALTIGDDGESMLNRKHVPKKQPLRAICFTSTGDVDISLCCYDVYPYLETSKDGINWNQWTDTDGDDIYEPISLNQGEILYVRGNNPDGIGYSSWMNKWVTFEMYCDDTVKVSCTGNIMHLISYEEDLTEIKQAWFQAMFDICTSLVNAPELPATTLADGCYYDMFWGCTSLVNAPALPATILADWCYGDMFCDCTSLQTITCLYEGNDLFDYTDSWVSNIQSVGTFYTGQNPQYDTTLRGDDYIPDNWNVVKYVQ